MIDGYYWVRHGGDLTTFIALLENGLWFVPGVEQPINDKFDDAEIIGPVKRLDH